MCAESVEKTCAMAEECPCPKTNCANHGKCCLCIRAHRANGKPVSCMTLLLEKK
jgi:hypothetical protein